MIETAKSYVQLCVPRDGQMLTSAAPRQCLVTLSVLYDRGLFIYYQFNESALCFQEHIFEIGNHDRLFLVLEDGFCCLCDPGVVPAQEVWRSESRASAIELVFYSDSWFFAIATFDGYLILFDYDSFAEVKRFNLGEAGTKFLRFVFEIQSCVALVEGRLVVFNLNTGFPSDTLIFKQSFIVGLHGTLLLIGFEDGEIRSFSLSSGKFVQIQTDHLSAPHSDRITAFAFLQRHWLSSSLDQTIFLWDYTQTKLAQVITPHPIYSIAALNGRGDIVIALAEAAMSLKWNDLVPGSCGPEIPEIDNYDKLADDLNPEVIARSTSKSQKRAITATCCHFS
jgi:WD40 repeat protein